MQLDTNFFTRKSLLAQERMLERLLAVAQRHRSAKIVGKRNAGE
jgi:hypothetical protein